jgi:hypothetical protein
MVQFGIANEAANLQDPRSVWFLSLSASQMKQWLIYSGAPCIQNIPSYYHQLVDLDASHYRQRALTR